MRLSPEGLAFLSHEEGLKTSLYTDAAGYPTIGVGHLLTDAEKASGAITINGSPVRYADGLTLQQVQDLLAQDCQNREIALSALVICPLTANQFDALFSLYFNIGGKAFSGSTLLKALNGGDWTNLETDWLAFRFAGGQPILLGRRQREWAYFTQTEAPNAT